MNGLNAMRNHVSDNDIILIHDGARPLVTEYVLRESINTALIHGSAVVAVPVKDTIKMVSNNIVNSTPQRKSLWQAQTPQTFRFGTILKAYQSAEANHFYGTDDASLVEQIGGEVHIIHGDYRNIKITTPEDLILAEAFLSAIKIGRN